MAHDVFLSYSSKDKTAADAACNVLERNGVRVWMAPRDVNPGAAWASEIIAAIHGARAMVLVFSSNANASPQIEREVERAINKGIPVIPVRVENVQPSDALEYYISTPHWLDAFSPPLEAHLEKLSISVKRLLSMPEAETSKKAATPDTISAKAASVVAAPATRSRWPLIAGGGTAIAVIAVAALLLFSPKPTQRDTRGDEEIISVDKGGAQPTIVAAAPSTPAPPPTGSVPTAAPTGSPLSGAPLARKPDPDQLARACDQAAADADDTSRPADVPAVHNANLDAAAAVPICRDAVDAYPQSPRLQFELGRALENLPGHADEAAEHLRRAAETGHAVAANDLGALYVNGKALPKNYAEAAKWFQKAIDSGLTKAGVNLGYLYAGGLGVTRDEARAVQLYRAASDAGDADATAYLGSMYAGGHGVKKDEAQAVTLYRKAADAGSIEGASWLGSSYRCGCGVKKDFAEAQKWLRKAADAGNAEAQFDLGELFYNGEGVKKDYTEAAKWYLKGAEAGNSEAAGALGEMYENGNGVPKNVADSAKWYQKSADLGSAKGATYTGDMYAEGRGVAQSDELAARYYLQGLKGGDDEARGYFITKKCADIDTSICALIQQKLIDAGLLQGKADGKFGPPTIAALQKYAAAKP